MSMSSTMIGRGTENGIAVARVVVGIINVRTYRALEDAGGVEVPLVRVLVLVGSSIDGRRIVGGLRVGAGVRRGRGHLYDAMHRLIGGDEITL